MNAMTGYLRRNPELGWGLGVLLGLILFTSVGRVFIDPDDAYALSVLPDQPPSADYPFGTDSQGKDLFAGMVLGTGMTLAIGAIAGMIGIGIGVVLGFVSGYYGGVVDNVITSVVDIVLTMPGFLILILIASLLADPSDMRVLQMGLIASVTAWAFPTRAIRAQVLSMRERPFVMMAKLSGMKGPEIILKGEVLFGLFARYVVVDPRAGGHYRAAADLVDLDLDRPGRDRQPEGEKASIRAYIQAAHSSCLF
jgi:peptide/nickel transport system permease protein